MPATYAHYRFGQQVKKSLPDRERSIIEKFPELYNIGLHGPDLLFYYKPLQKNKVNRTGNGLHTLSGGSFLKRAAGVIREHQGEEAYLSYLYGVICHFALDVTCHGYIGEKIAQSGISHTEIESELEAALLRHDKKDPVRAILTRHLHPTKENARVISSFYEGISPDEVLSSIRGMIRYLNLLVAPSRVKRAVIFSALRLSGNYEGMHGLILNYRPNPQCEDSTRRLLGLYTQARGLAERLIPELDAYLKGEKALDDRYSYNFNSQLIKEEEEKDEL